MKRLAFGLVIAVLFSLPLFAQQQAITISFNILAGRVEHLKDALTLRFNTSPGPGLPVPTIDDAFVDTWVTKQCRQAIDLVIVQSEREEARAGGPLDVSGLTRAQKQAVKELIAGYKK